MSLSAEFSSSEVLVPGLNQLFVAEVGTDFPASISETIDENDWLNMGYFDTDGLKPSFSRESDRVMADQSFDPLRVIITAVPKTLGVNLLQWNADSLILAMGGGEVVEDAPGEFTYTPPDESFVDERAALISMIDGDREYRVGYRKVMNQAAMETSFVRSQASVLPIEFVSLAADEGLKPYFIQTNDPAFEATVSA